MNSPTFAVGRLLWLAESEVSARKWKRLLRCHQTFIEPSGGGRWSCYSLVSDWFDRPEPAAARMAMLANLNPDWRLSVVTVAAPEAAA